MKKRNLFISVAGVFLAGLGVTQLSLAADYPTKFLNQDTIGNTRHNLTQRQTAGGGPNGATMDSARNNYGEVCVYCHTPHGAATSTIPLWNRVIKSTTYTVYSSSTLSGTVTQPGANSLSCLSCHDGQTAIDSIVNMPGSGRYNANPDTAFLNSWSTNPGGLATALVHATIDGAGDGCMSCHKNGIGATDFTAFYISTDLSNDHPIGVTLPVGVDWNVPGGTKGTTKFFDNGHGTGDAGNGRMEKTEIRFYDSGDGPEVECASCHDPHGVPTGAQGTPFTKTFLRVPNTASAVCLTCHNK